MKIKLPALALLGGMLILLAGCSHMVAFRTPYYVDGPSQLEPPQGWFDAGTPVLVIGKEGSYARVWSWSFVNAYVLDSELTPWWKYHQPADEPEHGTE